MQLVALAMSLETTCRMPREELLGLLNTMTPIEQQRITAEMTVATPSPEFAIRFTEPKRAARTRMLVIGASFVVSLGLGLIAALA
jgi:hypothetical protein